MQRHRYADVHKSVHQQTPQPRVANPFLSVCNELPTRTIRLFREVRQHTRYLLQTDSTYFNIYILQRHRIARYGMYPESHSFFIPHIYVRVYTHIFMQVNPVMILVEMKSLEGNNRILRNQCESDSVPLAMSFEQRAGIYPNNTPVSPLPFL